MKKRRLKPKGYELLEYDAETASRDNIEWFSTLTPAEKIHAYEEQLKFAWYVSNLKKINPTEKFDGK